MPFAKVEGVSSPSIAPVPTGVPPRLLDCGLLHYEASLAGLAERYTRGETSHTLHVWWARRPHSAMRALVFATLSADTSSSAQSLLADLGALPSPCARTTEEAREFLARQWASPPRVLDMFGGGGTIAYEVANLGGEAHALETNELALFIHKCNLLYPLDVGHGEGLALLRLAGHRVLKDLESETDSVFPLRRSPIPDRDGGQITTYIWTYLCKCPNCQYRFFLSKRPWLSKKNGRAIALVPHAGEHEERLDLRNVSGSHQRRLVWNKLGRTQCPHCHLEISGMQIADCEERIAAVVASAGRNGKSFSLAPSGAIPGAPLLAAVEQRLLSELEAELPTSLLPRWSGIVNPALYGIRTHSEFLNPRQRIVLLALIKALRKEYHHILKHHGRNKARYVIGLLSCLVDQLIDWNCRLSMWIPENEQVGRAFCGPGVSMLWDYAETDPVLSGPSNLYGKLQRIIDGTRWLGRLPNQVQIIHGCAQKLPYESDSFDAIVTDPPYYDNIFYSVLADFFYTWKRLILKEVEPELFSRPTTSSAEELVASAFRNGSSETAHARYCAELQSALEEGARVLREDGVFALLYSHGSMNGWEALLRSYRNSRLLVTSVQPLSIERRQRPRAMTSEAINTCLIFVARKSQEPKAPVRLRQVTDALETILRGGFAQSLASAGWPEEDIGIAIFAQGVGLLANAGKVCDADSDIQSLSAIEAIVQKCVPKFRIARRRTL